jgi:hypothetical protein
MNLQTQDEVHLGGDFIDVVSNNWFLTPFLGECVCCTPLVLLVFVVAIELWTCLQDIVIIKNIGEVIFNNEFCSDYGGLGNVYMVYFIPRYIKPLEKKHVFSTSLCD